MTAHRYLPGRRTFPIPAFLRAEADLGMGRSFEPTRAVEVIAPKYGSGYRIGGSLILTAAHLVPPSIGGSCRVRFRRDAGGGVWDATVVWVAPGWNGTDAPADCDVALIAVSGKVETCEPAMFGRLPGGVGGQRLNF